MSDYGYSECFSRPGVLRASARPNYANAAVETIQDCIAKDSNASSVCSHSGCPWLAPEQPLSSYYSEYYV